MNRATMHLTFLIAFAMAGCFAQPGGGEDGTDPAFDFQRNARIDDGTADLPRDATNRTGVQALTYQRPDPNGPVPDPWVDPLMIAGPVPDPWAPSDPANPQQPLTTPPDDSSGKPGKH